MPQVGGKHFSYDKAGYAAAQKEAAKTGKPLKKKKVGPAKKSGLRKDNGQLRWLVEVSTPNGVKA